MKYKKDPKPDSWAWERARRGAAHLMTRVKYYLEKGRYDKKDTQK